MGELLVSGKVLATQKSKNYFRVCYVFPLLEVLNMTFLAAKNDDSNDFNDFTHLFLLLFKGKSRKQFTANSCTFAGFHTSG